MPNKTVLTIAGFDPSSGAGITADLMVFAAHGLFGTACVTALTVQNTLGVASTHMVATDIIVDTLDNLHRDLPPAGIKIGMLGNASTVLAVAAFLARIREQTPVLVLLDPVLKSSSGTDLLDQEGIGALRKQLLPHVDWITPNVDELAFLVNRNLDFPNDLTAAATDLQNLGRELTIVVTGGHLKPPNDLLLRPAGVLQVISGQHIETSSTHGTGCAYSSALLSRLVIGDDHIAAAKAAKNYVAEAMRTAVARGSGAGPINHLWPFTHTSQPR